MSQQTDAEVTDVTRLKNGKITNIDSVSKRSVAAIFPNKEAADDAVAKLTEAGFIHIEIKYASEQLLDKGDYSVVVHAGERAVIALEILVNAGGNTNTNQPEQLAEQAEEMQSDATDNVVIAPEVLPNGKILL